MRLMVLRFSDCREQIAHQLRGPITALHQVAASAAKCEAWAVENNLLDLPALCSDLGRTLRSDTEITADSEIVSYTDIITEVVISNTEFIPKITATRICKILSKNRR